MLKTELLIQNVLVTTDIGITTKPNVHLVDICAKLVKPKNIVGPVPKTESVHRLVTAQITGSMPSTSVKNVLTNVNNVPELNPIVNLVPVTESMPQPVFAQLVPIILKVNQFVNHVLHNVSLVLIMIIVNNHVLVTE